MKKLIPLLLTASLLLTSLMMNAQDGKPTKEQTIAFIEEYFENPVFKEKGIEEHHEKKDVYYKRYIFKVKNMHIDKDCVLNFVISKDTESIIGREIYKNSWMDDPYGEKKIMVNLSKVEEITLQRRGNTRYLYYLLFKIKGESNYIELPFTNSDKIVDFKTIETYQIYKAFQHMRKLCGAPEPISFD